MEKADKNGGQLDTEQCEAGQHDFSLFAAICLLMNVSTVATYY